VVSSAVLDILLKQLIKTSESTYSDIFGDFKLILWVCLGERKGGRGRERGRGRAGDGDREAYISWSVFIK
jgi:hypothetical protein